MNRYENPPRIVSLGETITLFYPDYTKPERGEVYGVRSQLTKFVLKAEDGLYIPFTAWGLPLEDRFGVDLRLDQPDRDYIFDERDFDPDERAAKILEVWKKHNTGSDPEVARYLIGIRASVDSYGQNKEFVVDRDAVIRAANKLRVDLYYNGSMFSGEAETFRAVAPDFSNYYPASLGRVPEIPEEAKEGNGLHLHGFTFREGNPATLPGSISKLRLLKAEVVMSTKDIPQAFRS